MIDKQLYKKILTIILSCCSVFLATYLLLCGKPVNFLSVVMLMLICVSFSLNDIPYLFYGNISWMKRFLCGTFFTILIFVMYLLSGSIAHAESILIFVLILPGAISLLIPSKREKAIINTSIESFETSVNFLEKAIEKHRKVRVDIFKQSPDKGKIFDVANKVLRFINDLPEKSCKSKLKVYRIVRKQLEFCIKIWMRCFLAFYALMLSFFLFLIYINSMEICLLILGGTVLVRRENVFQILRPFCVIKKSRPLEVLEAWDLIIWMLIGMVCISAIFPLSVNIITEGIDVLKIIILFVLLGVGLPSYYFLGYKYWSYEEEKKCKYKGKSSEIFTILSKRLGNEFNDWIVVPCSEWWLPYCYYITCLNSQDDEKIVKKLEEFVEIKCKCLKTLKGLKTQDIMILFCNHIEKHLITFIHTYNYSERKKWEHILRRFDPIQIGPMLELKELYSSQRRFLPNYILAINITTGEIVNKRDITKIKPFLKDLYQN